MANLLDSNATNMGITATLLLSNGVDERYNSIQKDRMRWELAGRFFSEINPNVYYTIRLREKTTEIREGVQEYGLKLDVGLVDVKHPVMFSIVNYADMPTKRVMESAVGELKYRAKMWWKRILTWRWR